MIRRAEAQDAQAMGQVLSDWIDATPWMPRLHTHDEDAGFCARLVKTADVWVAEASGGLGFVARKGDSIDAFYLAPGLRRQGWGRALLEVAQSDRSRLTLWAFQANTPAIAFYQACGFVVVERTDGQACDEKIPDLRMLWERT